MSAATWASQRSSIFVVTVLTPATTSDGGSTNRLSCPTIYIATLMPRKSHLFRVSKSVQSHNFKQFPKDLPDLSCKSFAVQSCNSFTLDVEKPPGKIGTELWYSHRMKWY